MTLLGRGGRRWAAGAIAVLVLGSLLTAATAHNTVPPSNAGLTAVPLVIATCPPKHPKAAPAAVGTPGDAGPSVDRALTAAGGKDDDDHDDECDDKGGKDKAAALTGGDGAGSRTYIGAGGPGPEALAGPPGSPAARAAAARAATAGAQSVGGGVLDEELRARRTEIPTPAMVCGGSPLPKTYDETAVTGIRTVTTYNYNGVDGLIQAIVVIDGDVYVNYSIPAWLLDSYGGSVAAVEGEVKSNRLHNRTATAAVPCPQPAAPTGARSTLPGDVTSCYAPLDAVSTTERSATGVTLVTTWNYNGVQGLVQISYTDADGGTVVNLSYPDWLMQAYGNNEAAIRYDLAAGNLRNRRPPACG